ncbi:hypothetical protein L6452_36713 [Arctium lappa]|uniref:Uncharacterized protein n=1 Tax=Arctium lappa TaxID=4217 RepID=A0ACB8YAM8_ARCLA|nr:hypothetical protein L6452_36713 [Arctium lappa]
MPWWQSRYRTEQQTPFGIGIGIAIGELAATIFKRLFPPTTRSRRSTSSCFAMDFNIFKLCSGLKFLGYLMILLVAAIIAVSYYVVVVITWGPQLFHGAFKSLLSFSIIILFHLLVTSYFPSFYQTSCPNFELSSSSI